MSELVDPPPTTLYRCPFCARDHQPFPLFAGRTADAYSRVLVAGPYSSPVDPIGRSAHADTSALVRDAFNPWRTSRPELPDPLSLRQRLARLWQSGDP